MLFVKVGFKEVRVYSSVDLLDALTQSAKFMLRLITWALGSPVPP